MSDHNKHIFVAFLVSGALLYLLSHFNYFNITNYYDWFILALIVFIYSQIPDIDHDLSIINKIWNTVAGIIGIYCLLTNKYKLFGLFAIGSIVALEYIKHRGIVHQWWFGLIMAAPLYMITPIYFVFGYVSFLVHIFLDGGFKNG